MIFLTYIIFKAPEVDGMIDTFLQAEEERDDRCAAVSER